MAKLLILDLFNLIHRAYHALPKEFTDKNGNITGLSVSNEAVYQTGHSLAVDAADDILLFPLTGQVNANKEYKLSFINGLFPVDLRLYRPGSPACIIAGYRGVFTIAI